MGLMQSKTQRKIREGFQELRLVLRSLEEYEESICKAIEAITKTLESGGKVIACGNGGSSSISNHLVGELMGRFKKNRSPIGAISLNSNCDLLTCIANDYNFDDIFARQLQGIGKDNDILVAFSTSGESKNINSALAAARELGIPSIALLGKGGGRAKEISDYPIIIKSYNVARVQEVHEFIMHLICESLEEHENDE